jgi:hypothetical protein
VITAMAQDTKTPAPRCPKCRSKQTVEVFEHFGQRTFFCAECEHSWPEPVAERDRARQALAVAANSRATSKPSVLPSLRKRFVANVVSYRLVAVRTAALKTLVIETLAVAAALHRHSHNRRAMRELLRRRESAVH